MNDADDSVVTYIVWRLDVFSKALSGIFLILFPKRNLKKKYDRTYTFLFIQSVNEYNLKLMALKRLYTPKEWAEGLNTISYEKALTRGPTPYLFIYHFWHKSTPFVISFFNMLKLWNAA